MSKRSPALDNLLFTIRQHAAYKDLLEAVPRPALPRFRPGDNQSLETFGAKSVFESGRHSQHDAWLSVLTGTPQNGEK